MGCLLLMAMEWNGSGLMHEVRAWSTHRRYLLDVLHSLLTLLLALERLVANLKTIPTGAFIAFSLALCFSSLLAAPTSLLAAPTSLLAAPAWTFSLISISPFSFALAAFAFAFSFVGAIWGYVSSLVAVITDAVRVVLYAVDAVLEACRCPSIKRTDLLLNRYFLLRHPWVLMGLTPLPLILFLV